MKHCKSMLALLLVAAMLFSSLPAVSAAQTTLTVEITLTGNTGAVLTASQTVTATTQNTDLVSLSVNGSMVTVTAVSGAAGIAEIILTGDSETVHVQIPVGYTTFVFSGNQLTVIDGTDKNYEISGINSADEEYTVGASDSAYELPVTKDENGNAVYENTAAYRLNVGIKKKGGTYVFYGNSEDMSITVKKEATAPATLLLAGLNLASSFTSPVTIKKDSKSTVELTALAGYSNTLTDAAKNNADLYGDPTEDGGDGSNTAYAESAVIKGKTAAQLTINGNGTLNLICNSKNAVKIGTSGSLTIEDVTLNVTSAKHGLSSDNLLNIHSGTIHITAADDGIRSDPDAVDSTAGAAGLIEISGGDITVTAGSDGIQAAQNLSISGGSFHITTGNGYQDTAFNKDTMSCKGLKASNNSEDADTSEATNIITITGGTFYLNCADDAVHSDSCIAITGGTFDIYTGDDGVHADTTLNVGESGGSNAALTIRVLACYEGLEAGTVNIYSGTIRVNATDDGINAAGGSDSQDTPGIGFNPGGGWGGKPQPGNPNGDYSINISGGDILVNADGDGLDSNGALTLTGGTIIVWGQAANGDNEPLDCDGSLTVNGATVFAAGSNRMVTTPTKSQPYVTSRSNVSTGKTINVKYNGTTVFNIKAVKNINYVFYSSPNMSSSSGWTITADNAALLEPDPCTHAQTEIRGAVAPSCETSGYTGDTCCLDCGELLSSGSTIPATGHVNTEVRNAAAAGCETDGYTGDICCLDCGKLLSSGSTIPATGHVNTEVRNAAAAGCETDGYTGDICCLDCGRLLSSGSTIPATGHSWGEGVVMKEATCAEEGTTAYTCATCGTTRTETIPTTDHAHTELRGVLIAGCETDGYTGDTCCSDCGTLLYSGQIVPATGHSFVKDESASTEPTCIQNGRDTYICTACGATRTEITAALAHDYHADEISFNGYIFGIVYTCSSCGGTCWENAADCTNNASCPSRKFTDVDQSKWYHKAIDFTVVTGLFAGTSSTTFSPNTSMTRDQLVQVLYNLEGRPAVSGRLNYTDTKDGAWYANAVLWASNEGIVFGHDDGTFGVNEAVTREQIAAILYRYAVYKGYDVSDKASLNTFPDAGSVSSWAKANMEWAVGAGMISGSIDNGQTLLLPAGDAQRAQVASIIMRFVQNIQLNIDTYNSN